MQNNKKTMRNIVQYNAIQYNSTQCNAMQISVDLYSYTIQ